MNEMLYIPSRYKSRASVWWLTRTTSNEFPLCSSWWFLCNRSLFIKVWRKNPGSGHSLTKKIYHEGSLNNLHFYCNDLIIKAHLIEHDFINSMNLIVRVKSSKFRLKFLHSLADYLSINLISKVSFVKNFWGVFVLDMLALDTSNSVKSSFAKNKCYDRLIKATL